MARMMWAATTALALAPAASAAAQESVAVRSAPESELPFEFTRITGVFELADGRTVVVDGGDLTVQVADFSKGSTSALGRHGAGPGEYRIPMFLYPLGGDSVGILDDAAGRLLIVRRDGRPGGFLSPRASDTRRGFAAAARFGDGRGLLYGQGASIRFTADGAAQVADSAPILRWRVTGGPSVVVAHVHRPRLTGARVEGGSMVVVQPGTSRPALVSRSLWTVANDGRVAIVSADPYQVTLVSPMGEKLADVTIPFTRVSVSDSVKRAYLEERELSQTVVVDRRSGALSTVRSGRRRAAPATWADHVPPFRSEAFLAFDGSGTLWVQRTTFGREGARYDLIGRQGHVVARVNFPEGHRVVGFAGDRMYVVRRDADDLEYLQRVPLPVRP